MHTSIHLHNLTVSYQKHPAIHHIETHLPFGETTAIIGPNGAGKSTLLKAMMGFVTPDHGEVCLNTPQDKISYLPQQSEIDRSMPISIEELIATGFFPKVGLFSKISDEAYTRICEALEFVGLKGFGTRSISSLSNGQFQRALFARIIVQETDLLLLDEPFNAVDTKTVLDLCLLIKKWQDAGKTVIAVIHDLHIAKTYFSNTLMIARELIAFGKTENILNEKNIDKAYSTLLHWSEEADWCKTPNDVEHHE